MAKSRLGALYIPPVEPLVSFLFPLAAELVGVLTPLEPVQKPLAFAQWLMRRVNAEVSGQGWMLVVNPRRFTQDASGREPPLVAGAAASNVSAQLIADDEAGYDTSSLHALMVEIELRNTFYPATLADWNAFLDQFQSVIGHELVHVNQNKGAQRSANKDNRPRKAIYNKPFMCRALTHPQEPYTTPCMRYTKQGEVLVGYGIPIDVMVRMPDKALRMEAFRAYVDGPEEQPAWGYSVASELAIAGLYDLPARPHDSKSHLAASVSLANLAEAYDFSTPEQEAQWARVRRFIAHYLRRLSDAAKQVEQKTSRVEEIRAKRLALLAQRRGVQQVRERAFRPSNELSARMSLLELD